MLSSELKTEEKNFSRLFTSVIKELHVTRDLSQTYGGENNREGPLLDGTY